MSRLYRLSIIEVNVLEVVVELPDSFVETYPAAFINSVLNQAAADAVRQRWRMIHLNEDYPPTMPEDFQIEPLSDFDPESVGPGLGPFYYKVPIGSISYITKAPSGLAF
jgi:hypothetical protein